MRHLVYALATCLLCASGAFTAGAADSVCRSPGVSSDMPANGESVGAQCGLKFTRGLANVLTGSGEIPRQMIRMNRNSNSALAAPTGFFTGIFMTVVRTVYGAVEVVTFPMPLDGTYDSLLKPDYVWDPIDRKTDKGAGNDQTR